MAFIWSRFELTRTFTPRHSRVLVDFILSKRVRQSLVRTSYPWRDKRFSRTLPPTFLFLHYSIFKEQTPQTQCRGPFRFWLRGRPSVAYAALLNFAKGRLRSKLLRRQRRAALVREAYIVATLDNCQLQSAMFLNFLRQKFRTDLLIADCPKGTRTTRVGRPRWSPIAAALPFDTKANESWRRADEAVPLLGALYRSAR